MRILKYIFLLLLLAFIGLTVYVTTQKGDFEVSESAVIKTPKSAVFNYVNDYKNWETFGSWMKKGNSITFNYPSKTMGSGAFCSWESGSDSGNIKTYFTKENDSIFQKANFNGTKTDVFWKLKDTVSGTKITIHTKGKMDLMTKISTFFNGGISSILSEEIKKSFHNLNKTLDYEMKTYSIKVNGISQRNSGYCLKQTISCKIGSLPKNIKILMTRMTYFFKKNKLPMAGKPFVTYERYEPGHDFATISVCIPTHQQVYVMPGSDVASDEIIGFTCLKATLVGDYSHTQEAWKKAKKYIADNNFKENTAGRYSEVYVKTIDDVKQPSKWVTEIYIPVFPKAAAIVPSNVPTPETPAVIPAPVDTP